MPLHASPFDPLKTPPRVVLANFYPFAPGEHQPPRYSLTSLFLPCTQGRGEIDVGTETYALEAGQILHVPWAAPLQYRAAARDPFVLIGLHFVYAPWSAQAIRGAPKHTHYGVALDRNRYEAPPVSPPFERPLLLRAPGERLLSTAIELAECFSERGISVESDERQTSSTVEARLRGLALAFVTGFVRQAGPDAAATAHPLAGTVRELISWMNLSLTRPLSRADLAARAGVSESSVAAAFRAVTGRAPIDYLIEMRMTRARELLATGRERVGEVARRVGMPDVYYFSKLFKKRHGLSPLQFRKRRRL